MRESPSIYIDKALLQIQYKRASYFIEFMSQHTQSFALWLHYACNQIVMLSPSRLLMTLVQVQILSVHQNGSSVIKRRAIAIYEFIPSFQSLIYLQLNLYLGLMKRQRQDDPQISQQLKVITQALKCGNQHTIRRVCDNVNCQFPALFCGENTCEECTEMHLHCRSYSFEEFTKLVQKRTSGPISQFLQKIIQIENAMIETIQKQKRRYVQKFSLDENTFNLDKKYFKMIEDIFKRKDSKAINGKQASQLFKKLQETQIDPDSRQEELLQSFKNQSDRLMKEYMSMKDWIYDSALGHQHITRKLKEKKEEAWIQSNLLVAKNLRISLRDLVNSNNKKVAMFSRIIQDQLENEDKNFLKESFNQQNLRLEMIFRASQNGFSASRFHQICDNVENTLVIALNQFGKTFAGFTSLTWFGQKKFKSDDGNTSFMLSFDQKIKLSLLNRSKAIYCSQALGPTFGGDTNYLSIFSSYDLLIGDKCNTNASSYYDFPKSYQFHYRSTDPFNIFGIEKGKKFKILEYEVFKISAIQASE